MAFLTALITASYYLIPSFREIVLQNRYDWEHDNPFVSSHSDIDHILDRFTKKRYSNLEPSYLIWSNSDQPKFQKLLSDKSYTIIKREDFFKKIAGDFRIKDFVCRDSLYEACLFDPQLSYHWLIDKKLLYALVDLQSAIEAEGYDPTAFTISYGHRHPKENASAGGASLSRHISGQAIDMLIGDINQDGRYTDIDKQIVLDIANQDIIGDRGGIGRYPGTRTVHIDVRGYRARWDSY